MLFRSDDDDDDHAPSPADTAIRVLHASPDAPNVDVLVDDQQVLSDVPYKGASEFLPVAEGTRNIKVNAAGTSATVIDADLPIAGDTLTTIIAADLLNRIEPLVLSDDDSPPGGDLLKIRVVHASPSAPGVDVYVTAPGEDIDAVFPTLTNLFFMNASDFLDIPGDTYQIRITPAGSDTPVFDSGPVSLDAGSILTVVAVDAVNGASPVSLVVLTNIPDLPSFEITDSRARLRAIHSSPDAPEVDILVDGSPVAANVPFQGVLDYQAVPSGDRNITVNVAGTGTSVIDVTPNLAAGTDYTVLAVGFVSEIEPLLLLDDKTIPASGNAHLRVVHASPDAPSVDVWIDGSLVLADVAFKQSSDYLAIPAGNTRIQVNAAGSPQTVIDVTPLLEDGRIYTVAAINEVSAIEPLLLTDN